MTLGVILFLLAAGAPAAAGPAPKPPLVCRESTQQLGSHMRTGRRCMTQEQWQQEDERRGRIPITMRVVRDPDDAQRDAARPH